MDCDEDSSAVLQCETVSWLTEGRQIKPSELVRGFPAPLHNTLESHLLPC